MTVFLFTDIEGSTTRWEAHPDAMKAAVRLHDETMLAAMASNGGRVFKTVGDAFCVAFDDPANAIRAALQAQGDLSARDWSAIAGLQVRMALHAGDAEERAGDYFGAAVNRVARLLATAHGGQVVVSGAVADRVGQGLPDGVSLRALGTFRLKDLAQPERVFQVVAVGLPSDFKPLRTLEAVPNNLPQQTSGFVGREPDIARVGRLLHESTLVTIAGPGGVGKTRLALQCAAETLERMNDGAWFVNFAPVADPSLVAGTILGALRAPAGERDPLDALLAHLAERELLLVLDNCEHLIGEVARVVEAGRAHCPRVTVLDTCREALHLDGEHLYRLEPLERIDARRLFEERARAANARFVLDERAAAVVDAICGHLDCLPLAIELAAARVAVLSLDDLSLRLTERFRVLTGGTRTALPRQQTLRAMIDWSYDLLCDAEKILLARLGVFAGSFTLEAVTAVCGDETLDEWAVLDLLGLLVDKSLVVAEPNEAQRRYHLLESIRAYALERVDTSGESTPLAAKHADYFAAATGELYEAWDDDPGTGLLERFVPDLDNARAALRWSICDAHDRATGARLAGNMAPVYLRLSLLGEGILWCTRALEGADISAADRARVEYAASMYYNNQGRYPQALAAAECAVEAFRTSADERGTILALSQIGQQYARAGRFDDARPFATEASERARATGDTRLFARVIRRAAFSLPPAEIEAAREQFGDAVAALEALDAPGEASHLLEWWAEAEAAAGCFDRAVALGTRALDAAPDAKARMHRASNLAGYTFATGDFAGAAPLAEEGLLLAIEAKHALLTAIGIAYVAPTHARADAAEAARLYGYALAQMAELEWTGIASDHAAREHILRDLTVLSGADLAALFEEGAAWTGEEALARVRR
ncbi:MAG: tetratricopeptide repeat protein [Candidatus Eremiobacteraeota bacterium]|nr:tetratricopeptide repeat protein [Candidatus Eremiobacteraeota bacterium]